MKQENIKREKPKLLPSHFYEENGRTVFTEEYHIDRGYCCGLGCLNCAYVPKHIKNNTTLKKDSVE
jgi:hypothetical protein